MTDRFDLVRRIADTVLYEGYVLYPYRASAAKNQVRWQFGVLAPGPWCRAGGTESSTIRTECVVDLGPGTVVQVRVRGLQVEARRAEARDGEAFRPVARLDVGDRQWTTWDGAVEREIDLPEFAVGDLAAAPVDHPFVLAGERSEEVIRSDGGGVAGRVVTVREPVHGAVRVAATSCDGPYRLARLTVTVDNLTPWPPPDGTGGGALPPREEALRRSLVGVHTMLAVDGGRFVSQVDPPEFARLAAEGCRSVGAFPVLAGPPGSHDLVLSAPIILYDHPEIAPESQGDLCDSTEIDEILALRVLTLTDEEKREVRGTDARAAAILDRCEVMPPEIWSRLHGAVRSLRPSSAGARPGPPGGGGPVAPWWEPGGDDGVDPWSDTVAVGGVLVAPGCRVTLRPGRRADAQDLFLAGRPATVAGVFHDVDGDVHLAVVLDEDPASALHEAHGRYRYFRVDEVDPVGAPR